MGNHQTVHEIHAKYGNMDKEAFVTRFAHPFLVIEILGKAGETGSFQTMNENGSDKRPTEPVSNGPGAESVREMLAVPLQKSGRNSFHNMLTLGRASNNDVVLEHPSISKFHAYIRIDPATGVVSVADAGSSYGTAVEGKRVVKDKAVPLTSGANIRFAESVRATFLSTADFVDYMHLHLRMSK